MDRGRVGYDLVGNKTIRENALRHKRNCHLERLKKIKTRSAGSSKTLDNTTPESLLNQMIQLNPRKAKIKEDTAVTIQRENRALLQRISLILTAPPKITDADYQRLRKLATRDKVKEKFEKALDEKRNEEIFDRINKTNAYYHHKEWEEDYARQKAGQKFMRQVTYQRPKGFVDPFAPLERREEDEDPDDIDLDELLKEDEAKPQSDKGSRTPVNKSSRGGVATSKSSGHLNSVRTLRDKTSAGPHSADGAKNHQRSKTSPSKLERGSSRQKDSFNRSATGESTGSDDAASVAVHEPRPADKNVPVLLSHVHRHTPLRDGRLDVDRKLPNTDILTDIQCWRKTVQSDEIRDSTMKHLDTDFEDDGDSVNSANSTQPTAGKRRPVHIMTVRAEILDFSERETIMLLSVDKLLQSWQLHQNKDSNLLACAVQSMDLSNADTQQNDDNEKLDLIARQIAAEVSLIIENDTKVLFGTTNILRIVLPAHFAIAEVFKRVPKKGSDLSAELGVSGPARLQTNRLASFESIDTHDRDVDVEAASAEANKRLELSASNIKILFKCPDHVMAVGSTSSSAITAQMISATSKPFVELVTCDVVLRELGDEKASVSITVLSDFSSTQRNSSSTKSRSYETSIDKGTVFAMPLALPSIMTLDLDLVKEFFNNVLENMQLLHDRSTDKIVLCLKD